MPNKADNLLNKTKDNAKIERMKDALGEIIGKIRISDNPGIPASGSTLDMKI